MLRPLRRQALFVASRFALPIAGALWLVRLGMHVRRLRRAEVVLMPVQAKNFGHIVLAADIARRLFRGRRCLYIVVWEPSGTQNPHVADIFPDIDLLFLRRCAVLFHVGMRRVRIPEHDVHDRLAFTVTRWLSRRVAPAAEFLTLEDLYARLPIPTDLRDFVPPKYLNGSEWVFPAMALWARLVMEVPAPRLELPRPLRNHVSNRLRELSPGATGRCVMFHRLDEKGEGHHRNGSPLSAYVAGLRLLVDAGFQVLFAGDRRVTPEIRATFGGAVVDSAMLDVPAPVYRLYAATEADIFVGDAGGGMYIPMLNKIPQLVLNVFPFAVTAIGSWNVLKSVVRADGSPVPLATLLSNHVYFDLPAGTTARENTSEEIAEAVARFLRDTEGPTAADPGRDLVSLMPPETMFRAGNARLSPAFVERHVGASRHLTGDAVAPLPCRTRPS